VGHHEADGASAGKATMADEEGTYWYCMKHHRVEGYHGCPNSDRIGPFATEVEAEHALETIAARERKYEAEEKAEE
jgi:hypothetical protein